MNRRQAARLAELSDWLAPRETKFLFELIVPPEPAQLAELESEPEGFATELRPRLAATAIAELQAAGVEPDDRLRDRPHHLLGGAVAMDRRRYRQ